MIVTTVIHFGTGKWSYRADHDSYHHLTDNGIGTHCPGKYFRELMQQEHAARYMPEAFEFYQQQQKESASSPEPRYKVEGEYVIDTHTGERALPFTAGRQRFVCGWLNHGISNRTRYTWEPIPEPEPDSLAKLLELHPAPWRAELPPHTSLCRVIDKKGGTVCDYCSTPVAIYIASLPELREPE